MHPFEWDPGKALTNQIKHGVTVEEAQTVLFDEDGLLMADEAHSVTEPRYLFLGQSFRERVLVVSHCHQGATGTIRIISARKADALERAEYRRRRRT